MKTTNFLIFFILFICTVSISLAQEIVGKSYITNAANISINVVNTRKQFKIPIHTKFRVDGFSRNKKKVIISFWQYNRDSVKEQIDSIENSQDPNKDAVIAALEKGKNNIIKSDINTIIAYDAEFIGPWANYIQFEMELEDLNAKTQQYYGYSHNFTYGVMTMPVKLRFGNSGDRVFNFEENLNLGFTFGYQLKVSSRVKQAHNILGGIGISRVAINESSVTEETVLSDDAAEALMLNIGYLYQYETFQVGMFLGTDIIPGTLGRAWKFQGKPWLGIAIGVSLFSNDIRKSSEGENKL